MLPTFRLAADCNTILPDLYKGLRTAGSCDNIKVDNLSAVGVLLANVVAIALALAGLLAVGFIITGGVLYIMSQGQPDKIKRAKDTIVNAIIGLSITVLAYAIVTLVSSSLTGVIG
jgi:hypothetical protein